MLIRKGIDKIHEKEREKDAQLFWKKLKEILKRETKIRKTTKKDTTAINKWFASFFISKRITYNYFILLHRISYMEKWLIPHLGQWISKKDVDSTNNKIERFNLYFKRTLLRGGTYKKG